MLLTGLIKDYVLFLEVKEVSPVSLLGSSNNRFMTFIDSLGCRLYEGIADGWRSSWDTHMRRRNA